MHSDSPNDSWAIRFAQFVQRFGTLKLSILFVVLSLVFTLGGSYVIRVSMGSQVQPDDFISAVILTMLSAPWVLYFFSELIKQLENSRTNLKEVVSQLESLREEDVFLNRELQSNIRQLNHEIEQRKQAQEEREALFNDFIHFGAKLGGMGAFTFPPPRTCGSFLPPGRVGLHPPPHGKRCLCIFVCFFENQLL